MLLALAAKESMRRLSGGVLAPLPAHIFPRGARHSHKNNPDQYMVRSTCAAQGVSLTTPPPKARSG
jgi:hypothetical protein